VGAIDSNDRPAAAIAFLLLAMLIFVTMDGMSKYLVQTMAPVQIVFARFSVVSLLLVPALWRYRRDRPWSTGMPVLHSIRGFLLIGSSMLFVLALIYLPLEMATAIGFVSPLFVTALSIPLLKERVGPRRWLAVGVGFIGVLIVLRPGGAAFQLAMLLPILSSFCWALSLIITRRMRSSERPLTILTYSTLVGFIAVSGFALPVWRSPETFEWALLVCIGAGHVVAQYSVIRAFTLGTASLLAPFSYSTIVWATLIGALVFGTLPDAPTVVGTIVLVIAGLYVLHRERVKTSTTTVPGASIAAATERQSERSSI
jgi:drug/metabolite transporter (DMT)-like permease